MFKEKKQDPLGARMEDFTPEQLAQALIDSHTSPIAVNVLYMAEALFNIVEISEEMEHELKKQVYDMLPAFRLYQNLMEMHNA